VCYDYYFIFVSQILFWPYLIQVRSSEWIDEEDKEEESAGGEDGKREGMRNKVKERVMGER